MRARSHWHKRLEKASAITEGFFHMTLKYHELSNFPPEYWEELDFAKHHASPQLRCFIEQLESDIYSAEAIEAIQEFCGKKPYMGYAEFRFQSILAKLNGKYLMTLSKNKEDNNIWCFLYILSTIDDSIAFLGEKPNKNSKELCAYYFKNPGNAIPIIRKLPECIRENKIPHKVVKIAKKHIVDSSDFLYEFMIELLSIIDKYKSLHESKKNLNRIRPRAMYKEDSDHELQLEISILDTYDLQNDEVISVNTESTEIPTAVTPESTEQFLLDFRDAERNSKDLLLERFFRKEGRIMRPMNQVQKQVITTDASLLSRTHSLA